MKILSLFPRISSAIIRGMAGLRVKNIGPIKKGYESDGGFIDFTGITVFTGSQGSGKSTAAKIYSTLVWIEKALYREDFPIGHFNKYNNFVKQLDNQNIAGYLSEDSEIEYHGDAYDISCIRGNIKVEKNNKSKNYQFPKIMYVPAERNLISVVDRPELTKRLPRLVHIFLKEYDAARRDFKKGIKLPMGETRFEYDEKNKKSLLLEEEFEIDLSEASSGFQSLVPLYLVTRHLSRSASANGTYNYNCFLNIVEEPEQNLYPDSQKNILFELIRTKNEAEENQIVITTHSPYIISYLTLAVKAERIRIKAQINNQTDILEKLDRIVPGEASVDSEHTAIYQMIEDGTIHKLPDYDGLPSDENCLNEYLTDSNNLFIDLLELEEQCG